MSVSICVGLRDLENAAYVRQILACIYGALAVGVCMYAYVFPRLSNK